MQDDYCPIKNEDGTCRAGGECNHCNCWEKMHYQIIPKNLKKKIDNWMSAKRGDETRWRKK